MPLPNLLYQTAYADDPWWQGGLENTPTGRLPGMPEDLFGRGLRPGYYGSAASPGFFSSPETPTGGFGPTGRGPFQGRTDRSPQAAGLVHLAREQALASPGPQRAAGPAVATDLGGTGTLDPLARDPGPQQRWSTATGLADGAAVVPAAATPTAAPGGRMPGAAGTMPAQRPGAVGGALQGPSLTGQPSKGWWGRTKDYLSQPAFPRDEYGQAAPMSRLEMIGEMLGSAGRAIGSAPPGTSLLFAGLTGANQGQQQARALEEQRAEAASSNWLKRLSAEAALARATKPSAGASSEFERGVRGLVQSGQMTPEEGYQLLQQRLQSLATENREPTTAEAAMLRAGVPPEEVFRLKNQPSEIELRRLGLSEEASRRAEAAAARSSQQLDLTSRRLELQEERERRAAAAAETGRSLPERNRQLIDRVAEAVEGGGWETVTPEDRRAYNRVYREMASPRREIDPLTGTMTEIQPDVTDLPVPPGYGGAAAGAAPPRPGVTQPERVLGREQVQAATEARRVHDEGLQAIDRVNQLLDAGGAQGRLVGEDRARLTQAVSSLTTLLGSMSNAGVLQPSDLARFERELGGITGPLAAAGAAVGYEPARAALEELKVRLERHLQNRLPKVTSEEEARAMPPGVPFLLPSGRVGQNQGG